MKKKILIIDDDSLILYGLAKALGKDVDVSTASSAALAEELIAVCSYDLCLLDIHLSDYNGLELMKTIRDICPLTKVIIMTASYIGDDDLNANIIQAAENGACYFFTKPFDLNEVKDVVRQALQDGDFYVAEGIAAGIVAKGMRRSSRRRDSQQMELTMTIIGEGASRRCRAEAESLDISTGGAGLLTSYPLRVSQVVCLKYECTEKTGVVVWSRMEGDCVCRAGISFA
jgi:DNA-binding NtrC family response regulator